MLFQPWLESSQWEQNDPKLENLEKAVLKLPHFESIVSQIPLNEGIYSILGPRQVGKSTLLRRLAQKFLKKLPPEHVALIEGDLIEDWKELLGLLEAFTLNLPKRKLKALILIDEITSIQNWQRALKFLADQNKLVGCVVVFTGSSAFSLKQGGEFLPGRRGKNKQVNFSLMPASFADVHKHMSLKEFMFVGGFPWAVNEYLKIKALPEFVGEIYWSWIKGEFLKNGKSDVLLRHTVKSLIKSIHTGVSHSKVAQDIGISSHDTARQYLELLEDCFAINSVYFKDIQTKQISPRKNKKFYPIDPLLYHLFKSGGSLVGVSPSRETSSETFGEIAELIVCEQLKQKYNDVFYWRTRKEIDFVSKEFIEVKFQNRVTANEFTWVDKYLPSSVELTVLTKNDRFKLGRVQGVPLEEWLLKK